MKLTPVHYRVLIKFFEESGWKEARTRGDHVIFTKRGILRPVVIPKYKNIPIFIIKNNLRTAGITTDEFLKAIKRG